MENTGGDESCINGNNEIHNTRINNMVRAGILDSDQHEKNDAVKQIHQQKYIYASSIGHYTTHHITFNGMARILVFVNS